MDWTMFWAATTAAATIATAITTGAVLWLKGREKPCPEWIAEGVMTADEGVDPETFETISVAGGPLSTRWARIVNVGDGTAFQCRMTASGCEAGVPVKIREKSSSVVEPGHSFDIWATTPGPVADASIEITWLASPTRLGKRWKQTLWLSEWMEIDGAQPARSSRRRKRKPTRLRPRTQLQGS